jgi:hypothetical protein
MSRRPHAPAPGDERALLDFALSVVMTPLPRSAPLWSAVFITGLTDGGVALLIVLHHVLADGLGGLMVLTSLADGPARGPGSAFPRPAPSAARLFQDAWRERLARAAPGRPRVASVARVDNCRGRPSA